LVAQSGDSRHIQQTRVLGSVGRMASRASLHLDGCMFEHERSARLGVALGANRVLIGGGLQIVVSEGPVNVVTVAALDQAFVHLVMEGHVEVRLDVGVALEAELGLTGLQQVLILGGMNIVTADAAHIGLGVGCASEVLVLAFVAAQALLVHFGSRCLGGIEDLGDIATAIDVFLARSMATFAGYARLAVHLSNLGVRIVRKSLGDLFVASGAGFAAHKIRRSSIFSRRGGFVLGGRRSAPCADRQNGHRQNHPTNTQSRPSSRSRINRRLRYWLFSVHQYHLGDSHRLLGKIFTGAKRSNPEGKVQIHNCPKDAF